MLSVPPYSIDKGPKLPPKETCRFDLDELIKTKGQLDHAFGVMKIITPLDVKISREEIISFLRKENTGVYYQGEKIKEITELDG